MMKLKLVLVPEPWVIMNFWYNPKMLQLDEFGSKLVAENKIWKKTKNKRKNNGSTGRRKQNITATQKCGTWSTHHTNILMMF